MTFWLTIWLTVWLTGWLNVRLTDWLNARRCANHIFITYWVDLLNWYVNGSVIHCNDIILIIIPTSLLIFIIHLLNLNGNYFIVFSYCRCSSLSSFPIIFLIYFAVLYLKTYFYFIICFLFYYLLIILLCFCRQDAPKYFYPCLHERISKCLRSSFSHGA